MKILIADDDPVTLFKLEELLKEWGYEVISVSDGNAAWNVLTKENPPILLILDWMMPGMDGIEICRKVREVANEPYTYILLLTSKTEDEDMVKGMEAGADDYITKPFNQNELRVRLRAGRRLIELNEALLKSRDTFQKQATHDSLTGILNRRAITDSLKQEMERSNRERKNFSVVLLDIDHFKKINDTYGHLAGDQVLREMVKRLCSTMRPYDSIGRYGGEEFIIILPDCDSEENAIKQAERLRKSISRKPIDTSEGIINVTGSFGVSIFTNGKGLELEPFVKQADGALYRAKKSGRDRVEISTNS